MVVGFSVFCCRIPCNGGCFAIAGRKASTFGYLLFFRFHWLACRCSRQRVSTLLTPFRNAARLVRTRRAYPSPSPPTPRTIPAPTSSPTDAPTGGRAEERTIPAPTSSPTDAPTRPRADERTIPAPTSSPTGGCDADAPTGASPAASPAGRADSRSRQRRATNEGTVKRDVAMIGPAITEIGSNPEGAPH